MSSISKKQISAPIGIFGGSFDPVHHGHLRVALELLENLKLAEIRFIPCKAPVHKEKLLAENQHRLAMLKLAIAGQPGFYIDDRELKRATPSYTYLTLESLRAELPTTPLCLILGEDAFQGLPSWYQFNQLLSLCHIIIVRRPDSYTDEFAIGKWYQSFLVKKFTSCRRYLNGKIYIADTSGLAISATKIRQLIQQQQSPRYLVTDPVFNYIQQKGLYLTS